MTERSNVQSLQSATLADVLERVLDKGLVIAGDIKIQIADIELLTIKIRLMIASVDKAKELGVDWWERDSYLSAKAADAEREQEIGDLKRRIEELEERQTGTVVPGAKDKEQGN
ncbi:MAG: gas vesicle protein [Verrucomicrobia bacterium]|nr:gas vesicle protein [Verrucomicrobiota bacterium]MCF7707511.1 gas vesicle protein [Verrucomicrobiota bacterium]